MGEFRRGGGGGRRGDADEQYRKIFVGGLSYETTDDSLRSYFSRYGEITDCIVMKEKEPPRKSRGFGFVTFGDKEMVDKVQGDRPHVLDGKEVDTKRAQPREESDQPEAHASVKKIFVGGVRGGITESDLRDYFSKFGPVEEVDIRKDKDGLSRGFGFVTLQDTDVVDKIVLERHHSIAGRSVEARKAVSKEEKQQAQERMQARQSRRGGGDGRGGSFGQGGGGGGNWGYGGGNQGGGSYSQGGGYGQGGGYSQGGYSSGGGGGGGNWGGNQGNWGGQQQAAYGGQQQSWGGQQQSWGGSQGGYNQGGGGGGYGGGGPMGQDRSYSQRSGGPYGGGFGNQGGGGYRR